MNDDDDNDNDIKDDNDINQDNKEEEEDNEKLFFSKVSEPQARPDLNKDDYDNNNEDISKGRWRRANYPTLT